MIFGFALGALIGMGIVVVSWGLFPPREPLRSRLSELDQPSQQSNRAATRRDRIGRGAVRSLGPLGIWRQRTARDLRVVNQTLEQLAISKLAIMLLGAGLPVAMWIIAWANQVWISPVLVALASILGGGLLFWVPDLLLREKAQNRRRDLRHQISAYLDLVGLHLSGGAGIEQALSDSAALGTSWGFVEIRRGLKRAQLANEPPWAAFEELGQEMGSTELVELAAWLMLAGTSGSGVRSSLQTKARGLRERALTEAETQAQRSTERMSLPVVLMFTGFLGLIGYPAFAAIAGS